MSDIVNYNSQFEPTVNVFLLFKENEIYDKMKPLFDEYGYGFASAEDRMVFLDGESVTSGEQVDEDALRFIEAHEVSHILLDHSAERNDEDEMDADLGAYILLTQSGKTDSIKTLLKQFKNRHGIKFDEKLLNRVKKYFS